MVVMVVYRNIGALCEQEYVEDLQDSAGVHKEKHDEPDLLMAPSGEPQRPAFPKQCPEDKEEDKERELVDPEAGAPVESARPER